MRAHRARDDPEIRPDLRSEGAAPMSRFLLPQEAQAHPCPFFRFLVNEADVTQHGVGPIYVHESCRADACIGWRWQASLTVNNPTRANDARGNQVGQKVDF